MGRLRRFDELTVSRVEAIAMSQTDLPEDKVLTVALEYEQRGLAIIPIRKGSKVAGVKWKRFQERRPTVDELRRWFDGGKYSGLAVVLGPVSGHLACRDFDDATGYERWATEFPDLAKSLPTVKTYRGYHVYFTVAVDKTTHLEDGELRGAGAYCLLPPSAHPDGAIYEWVVPLNGEVLAVDSDLAGFLSPVKQKQTEGDRSTLSKQTAMKATEGEEIELALQATLPTGPQQRNRKVFDYARRLMGIEGLADANLPTLKPLVRRWHKRALPFICTKEFDDTWVDFVVAWKRVQVPFNANLMPEALRRARKNPVEGIDYERPELRDLVALCRELQLIHGDRPGKRCLKLRYLFTGYISICNFVCPQVKPLMPVEKFGASFVRSA